MRPVVPLCVALVCLGGPVSAQDAAGPGIPLELARTRAAMVRDVRYDLTLRVPARRSARLAGRMVMRFSLPQVSGPLVVDFAEDAESVRSVSANGSTTAHRLVRDHIVIDAAALRQGPNQVAIDFEAGDASLNRGDDFLYSLFVPARAHRAIPCFDQPDIKARVSLTLEIPKGWQAVANGAEVSRREVDGRDVVTFAETQPLSTYVMAFAAGVMQVETATRGTRTFRMFHRENDAAKVARNRDAIFDLHASAIAWLETYTGVPYPWGKFDFFLVPAFQFGGMEHPGAIFYNAPAMLLDESATQAQTLNRASLIAHETAHMWFGDLVTMRWFDDVWTKEVYANFFAAKIVNPSFPAVDHELRFLLQHYPGAYEIDRTEGTHPIRQALDNLDEAGTLYGNIIYLKAPIVMRQLELLVGADTFRTGMREYIRRFSFGNATWPELIQILDGLVDADLAAWSTVWVEREGRPSIRAVTELDASGAVTSLAIEQRDPKGRGLVWPQLLHVTIAHAGGTNTFPVQLNGRRVEIAEAKGLTGIRYVLPTGDGLAYGDVELDTRTRDTLFATLPDIAEGATRGAAIVTLTEELVMGRVTPQQWMDLAMRAMPRERDEQLLQRMASTTSTVFWQRLTPAQRDAQGIALERVLRSGLAAAPTRTAKAVWFSTLVDIARTSDTLAWLMRVWKRDEAIEGLPLAEPDETNLAFELALRGVDGWPGMLDGQQARITNPDRAARFAFIRPALDTDPAIRDGVFAALARPENRKREPWVADVLNYLHHPLRGARGERYVQASLDMLEEIRNTGDIFFPKRWMDATLRWHRSPAVASMVRGFLATHPDYPVRLKRIILQSADDVLREAR